MFSISICVGNTVWAFRYKTEEAARKVFEALTNPNHIGGTVLEDDFGQKAKIIGAPGIMFEDMNKSRAAHVEQLLHNASIQQEATRKHQSAPRGPGIVSPAFPSMPIAR